MDELLEILIYSLAAVLFVMLFVGLTITIAPKLNWPM